MSGVLGGRRKRTMARNEAPTQSRKRSAPATPRTYGTAPALDPRRGVGPPQSVGLSDRLGLPTRNSRAAVSDLHDRRRALGLLAAGPASTTSSPSPPRKDRAPPSSASMSPTSATHSPQAFIGLARATVPRGHHRKRMSRPRRAPRSTRKPRVAGRSWSGARGDLTMRRFEPSRIAPAVTAPRFRRTPRS
jgi:hypothetical protein